MNTQTHTPPTAVPPLETAEKGPSCGTGSGRTWSLERQARIAAGLLNLAGAIGSFYAPKMIYLCGLVGLGLIFAGITGVCGITYLLVYLPWNRQRGMRA